jgi:TAG lipase/steryl ester hydrolase/phospholipase A2/LPA acyltransferase
VPFVFRPFNLMAKDPLTGEATPWNDLHKQYIDGSVDGDLPMTRLSEMFNVNHFIVSQVNPHVVPFLPKEDGPTNHPEQGLSFIPRWMNTMTHLAKDEVLYRMTVLSELGVFPTSMTKAASIMNQKYSGDINIYPELISSNFPRILENPTTEFMLQACLSGERATWPRLSRIRNACAIELALDRAVQQMRARVAFSPGQLDLRMRGSLHHSTESIEGGMGRGRIRNRRRGSHSHELERRRSRALSRSLTAQGLRKARSTLSLETPSFTTSNDFVSVPTRPKAHRRRSSMTFGTGVFSIESDSDDEDDNGVSYSINSRPSHHRGSWDFSSHAEEFSHGRHSPVRSRRSSFSSGRRQRSGSGQQASPKQVYAASAREISMALSPSSRHLLSMTPTVHATSPDSLTRKARS